MGSQITLYEWEYDIVATLKQQIEQIRPNREMSDGVCWIDSENVEYPVKNIAEKMSESYASVIPKPVISLVWQKFLPPRAQLLIWMANLGKLKTGDYLAKWGIIEAPHAVRPFCYIET